MSTFAERLDKVIDAGNAVIIDRFEGAENDFIRVEFAAVDDKFGRLKQVEYLDADDVTPGRLIKTIETLASQIDNAIKTITEAQDIKEAPEEVPEAE